MSFKSKFLELDMKSQITYTISFIFYLIFLLVLLFFGSCSYEILRQSSLQRANYFEDIALSTLKNIIRFQNYQIYLYEDFIKASINQLLYYISNVDKETWTIPYELEKTFFTDLNTDQDNNCILNKCFYYYAANEDSIEAEIKSLKLSLIKLIPTIITIQNMALFFVKRDELIFDDLVFYFSKYKIIFSLDKNTNFSEYNFNSVNSLSYNYIYDILKKTENSKIFDYIFPNKNKNDFNMKDFCFKQPLITLNTQRIVNMKNIYSGIGNDNSDNENNEQCIVFGYFHLDFYELFFLNFIKKFKGFIALPSNKKETSDTAQEYVSSYSPCNYVRGLQKDKTLLYKYNADNIRSIHQLDECFKESETQEIIANTYFNETNLFLFEDKILKKDFINLQSNAQGEYLYMKTVFPTLNVTLLYRPQFVPLSSYIQYSFYNYYPTRIYIQNVNNISFNLWLFILMILIFIWHVIHIIIYFLANNLSESITNPIKNLRSSVESMAINDESIFVYKNDEIINDLFITSRALLKGELLFQHHDQEKDTVSYTKNIFFNQEVISKYPSDQNILKNDSGDEIGYYKKFTKHRRKHTMGVLTNEERKIEDYDKNYKKFLNISKIVYDNNKELSENKMYKRNKCILYEWYQERKKGRKDISEGVMKEKVIKKVMFDNVNESDILKDVSTKATDKVSIKTPINLESKLEGN